MRLFGFPRPAYSALAPTTRDSSLDDDEGKTFLGEIPRATYGLQGQTRFLSLGFLTFLNLFFFIVSCTLFGSWFYQTHLVRNAAYRQLSTFTPLLDLLDLNPRPQLTNGTFFPPRRNPSFARQMPNPAADAIWEDIELARALPVSTADLVRMGKDPTTAAKLPDSHFHLGDDAHIAILDVFHHMHCVNSLRQLAYAGYYNKTPADAFANPPGRVELHINHCVDMLVQALQCSGNLNLVTYHWVETQPWPYPDFSIQRKCPDFDAVTAWRRENTVDMDLYMEVFGKGQKPQGIKQMPAPDGVFEFLLKEPRPKDLLPIPDEDYNL